MRNVGGKQWCPERLILQHQCDHVPGEQREGHGRGGHHQTVVMADATVRTWMGTAGNIDLPFLQCPAIESTVTLRSSEGEYTRLDSYRYVYKYMYIHVCVYTVQVEPLCYEHLSLLSTFLSILL